MRYEIVYEENGRPAVLLKDMDTATNADIQAFKKQLAHSGFAFQSDEEVREMLTSYAETETPLWAAISYPLLCVLGAVTVTKEKTERHRAIVEKALQMFGTTTSFRKAGFILRDGRMLDFSDDADDRGEDHRSIKAAYDAVDELAPGTIKFGTVTEYLNDFINQGNIRVLESGLDIGAMPTPKQEQVIRRFALYKRDFIIDISNERGYTALSTVYQGASPGKVVQDIRKYFMDLPYHCKGVPLG